MSLGVETVLNDLLRQLQGSKRIQRSCCDWKLRVAHGH